MWKFKGAKVKHRILSWPIEPTQDEIYELFKSSTDYYDYALKVIELYEKLNESSN